MAYDRMKRTFDAVLAGVLLTILAPFGVLLMLLIWATMGRPILFTQQRVGLNGSLFRIVKFRTLDADYPRDAPKPPQDDPRISLFGNWLRRTCLDEVPQLINVLRGDMSLVGPRPEMPFIVARYSPEQATRLSIRPGITGLWQLYADTTKPIHESIDYDLDYIRRRSLWLDAFLLLRTAAVPLAVVLPNGKLKSSLKTPEPPQGAAEVPSLSASWASPPAPTAHVRSPVAVGASSQTSSAIRDESGARSF